MPKIAVCIPTKNGTVQFETVMSVDKVDIIPLDGSQGLANALNKARDTETETDIVLFLSSDDILLPNALEQITKEFEDNPDLKLLLRPYYWFKDDWKKPLRKTKYSDYKIEDLIFLTGQLSGIAVRKDALNYKFQEKRFVEFASGVLPIIRDYECKVGKETVAIRIDSSEARTKGVYDNSPALNWSTAIRQTFWQNPQLCAYMNKKIGSNYIGFIQIRSYGGIVPTLREIAITLWLNPLSIFNPKFYFYSLLVILTPACVLRFMAKWFICNINQWFVK
jgi:glycosyltransferase involved in cell wall biosynthesis